MNFCLRKLETKSRKFACNGFPYFKFNEENCREPKKTTAEVENETRRQAQVVFYIGTLFVSLYVPNKLQFF